jgi:hypothetical protein
MRHIIDNSWCQLMDEEQKPSTQPLYEFVADDAYPTPDTPPENGVGDSEGMERNKQASASLPSEEEIRRGLIYPPPPSFYQNMQIVSAQPPTTPVEGAYHNDIASAPTNERSIRDPRPDMGHYPPAYPPYMPGPLETKPPTKRPRTWIWIVASVLGVALLASCGLCGWGMYSIFSTTFQQVLEPLTVTQNYYSALQAKNYSLAYSYISPQGTISSLTLDEFTQRARAQDSQYGAIRSYTPGQPAFTTSTTDASTDLTHATITVSVTRPQLHYNVLLTLQKIGGQWKIVDFDRL